MYSSEVKNFLVHDPLNILFFFSYLFSFRWFIVNDYVVLLFPGACFFLLILVEANLKMASIGNLGNRKTNVSMINVITRQNSC